MNRRRDAYDDAVDLVKTLAPERIFQVWQNPRLPGGALFRLCGTRNEWIRSQEGFVGCLTMIRLHSKYPIGSRPGIYLGVSSKLTRAIRRDDRIPVDPRDLNDRGLRAMAEWHRLLDRLVGCRRVCVTLEATDRNTNDPIYEPRRLALI